jgi:hypothetical protein
MLKIKSVSFLADTIKKLRKVFVFINPRFFADARVGGIHTFRANHGDGNNLLAAGLETESNS